MKWVYKLIEDDKIYPDNINIVCQLILADCVHKKQLLQRVFGSKASMITAFHSTTSFVSPTLTFWLTMASSYVNPASRIGTNLSKKYWRKKCNLTSAPQFIFLLSQLYELMASLACQNELSHFFTTKHPCEVFWSFFWSLNLDFLILKTFWNHFSFFEFWKTLIARKFNFQGRRRRWTNYLMLFFCKAGGL